MIHKIKLKTICGMTKLIEVDFEDIPQDCYLVPLPHKTVTSTSRYPAREFIRTEQTEVEGNTTVHIFLEGDTY